MSQKRPKIVKMSIDSLVQTTLVKLPDGHMPVALALNYDTQVLYWADSGNDSVYSIGTKGSNMHIIVPDLKLTVVYFDFLLLSIIIVGHYYCIASCGCVSTYVFKVYACIVSVELVVCISHW